MFVILGDRYDILPIAIMAQILNIPIAHFHGGEKTIAVLDDNIRHAITKLSHLHFVSICLLVVFILNNKKTVLGQIKVIF